MPVIFHILTHAHIYKYGERETALTIENFIELSWRGMDDKIGCYAYLHTKKRRYRLRLEVTDLTRNQQKTLL